MLLRCIRAENRKLHASPIWFMFFILPIISAGYGTFNYLQNLEILRDGWYSLWTQHTLFYSLFFFPCMIVSCNLSKLCCMLIWFDCQKSIRVSDDDITRIDHDSCEGIQIILKDR